MTVGAFNSSADNFPLFDRAMSPQSSALLEGAVAVHVDVPGDNLAVDVPTAANALAGGRAFAGLVAASGPVDPTRDKTITIAKAGIRKARLKANTACVAGTVAAYNPADGGTVIPLTPTNAGIVVPIGRFSQSKAASAGVQLVGVELYGTGGAGGGDKVLGAIVASSTALSGTSAETAFDQSIALPAGRIIAVGTVIKIRAKVRVTAAANSADTLTVRARLDTAAGVLLGATPAVDVATGGGDIAVLDLVATVRAVGASGTLVSDGFGGITPGQAVTTGGNVQTTGTAGTVAIDTTVAHALVITGQWSSNAGTNSCVLESLVVTTSA